MKRFTIYLSIFGLFLSLGFTDPEKVKSDSYKQPNDITDLLFYIQRNVNENTVIYKLNREDNGLVNKRKPVEVFWINYAHNSEICDLTYIQRNYSYGISSKALDSLGNKFMVQLSGYKKRPFYIIRSEIDMKYRAYIYMGQALVKLNKIHIQIEGGTFWFPKIKFVQIKGESIHSGKEIVEIIKP